MESTTITWTEQQFSAARGAFLWHCRGLSTLLRHIHLEREEASSAGTWDGLEDFRQEHSTEQEQDWWDSETGDLRDPRGILEVSCSGSAKS